MKRRFALVLVLIFIFGVSCGGIYQLTFGSKEKLAFPAFISDSIEKFEDRQAAKKAQKEEERRREKEIAEKIKAEKEGKEPQSSSAPESEAPKAKGGKITNPEKFCSTEGCDRAVFVEYNGKELCTKCYAEAKRQASQN